jgi:polysaccharide export outer membrane protein
MNMGRKLLFMALLIAALVTVKASAVTQEPSGYIIGPGDILFISVWKVPELSGEYEVGPDGVISLPLIGTVKAQGLRREELASKIREKLFIEFNNPVVSVQVRKYLSRYIYVVGNVRNPGLVILPEEPTLLKALTLAGGVTRDITPTSVPSSEGMPYPLGKVSIIRGDNQIIMVNLDELLRQGNMQLNQNLEPGDVVNVSTDMDAHIYVMGQVARPGLYALRSNMGALDAVALAGSYTADAQAHGLRVVRNIAGKNEIITVDLYDIMKRNRRDKDVKLQPGDIVYMPNKAVALFHYYINSTIPSATSIFLGITAADKVKGL